MSVSAVTAPRRVPQPPPVPPGGSLRAIVTGHSSPSLRALSSRHMSRVPPHLAQQRGWVGSITADSPSPGAK